MPTYHVYGLDETGTNPDNLISGEPYTLSGKDVRFIVPRHGSFFTSSVVIYDAATMVELAPGDDYEFPLICQEPTLRYGKEIADAILIKNKNVSDNVLVTRQVLGGQWQDNAANAIAVYESIMNDTRPVHWDNVIGKWSVYPPAPHPVWMKDIYGFEPLVFVLERIANAITTSVIPSLEYLLKIIQERTITGPEVDSNADSDKLLSFTMFKRAIAPIRTAILATVETRIQETIDSLTTLMTQKDSALYTQITSETNTKLSGQYVTITSETQAKLNTLRTQITTETDNKLSAQKTLIESGYTTAISTARTQITTETDGKITAARNAASTALAQHVAAGNPHPQYILAAGNNNLTKRTLMRSVWFPVNTDMIINSGEQFHDSGYGGTGIITDTRKYQGVTTDIKTSYGVADDFLNIYDDLYYLTVSGFNAGTGLISLIQQTNARLGFKVEMMPNVIVGGVGENYGLATVIMRFTPVWLNRPDTPAGSGWFPYPGGSAVHSLLVNFWRLRP